MKRLDVKRSCPPLPDLTTVEDDVIAQAGGDYGGNLPRSCPFLVYEFAVYALVPEGRVRFLHHH